jgi:probable HAF family extracellular repeat protein
LVLAGTFSVLAQTYTITEIGVLKGDNESSGFWLNSAGQVVGCSDTGTANGYPCTRTTAGQHAFLWSKSAGLKDLGTMSGGTISDAIGINDAGQVVGCSNVKGSSASDFFAFLWPPAGGMTNLGTLSGGNSSCAFEINSARVIVGDSFISNGNVNAVSWTNNKIRNLGGLPRSILMRPSTSTTTTRLLENPFSPTVPLAIARLRMVGRPGHERSRDSCRGDDKHGQCDQLLRRDGGPVQCGWLPECLARRDVERGAENTGPRNPVRWYLQRGVWAFGINDSDEVVAYGNISNNAAHAFLWTQAAGMRDLNSLIPANSGWVLINANAINRLGQITG